MKTGIGVAVWAGLLGTVGVQAADWPQWRGPSGLGISSEAALPARWSRSENIAWKASLAGFGASSPIVTGGIVIVTSQAGGRAARHAALWFTEDVFPTSGAVHLLTGGRLRQ